MGRNPNQAQLTAGKSSQAHTQFSSYPPEVLSEIFIQCLPTYSAAPAAARAPMLLTTICKDWREIALSTPHLWSTFILSVDLVKTKDGCSLIRLFDTWLARGGTCPLTMVINGVSSGLRAEHSLPASFISALSRSSSRWHDVNLMLPLADFYRLQANEGLPQLRRLSIKATANTAPLEESESPFPPLNLFSHAPLLEDVSLEYGFILSNVTLPLHQLTYFDSRASTTVIAHYLEVFRKALGLIEIRLDVHNVERWGLSVPVQSNVKSINLRSSLMGENTSLNVLDSLTCPELETLVISGLIPMLSEPLLRFLPRSSPPAAQPFH
ncbi:F-box domain-containing protein [Mycena venus]|uniref:F-box domain-containing protein n=1 Tax=Mycena venus TaxID=2733690 RepID=A0A8H6WT45_9AGAR|nr:F-box domain-containing protein [Mycena venus]